jgi:hypothetical protein
VTIEPPGPRWRDAGVLRSAGGQPGEATGAVAALGGAVITGDRDWDGTLGTAAGRTGSGYHPDRAPLSRRPSCGSAWLLTPSWRIRNL